MLGNEITLAIAGNKSDLAKDRAVPLETAEAYAAQVGAKYYETSAKLNDGVEELFLGLTSQMIEVDNVRASQSRSATSNRRANALRVEETDNEEVEPEERRGRCCSS